jgi:hypothetical protein
MSESDSEREPLEELAESFLARYCAGERPSLSEVAAAHPELADQIRELFTALLEMEQAGSADDRPATDLSARREQQEGPGPIRWAAIGSSTRSAGAEWGSSTRRSRTGRRAMDGGLCLRMLKLTHYDPFPARVAFDGLRSACHFGIRRFGAEDGVFGDQEALWVDFAKVP